MYHFDGSELGSGDNPSSGEDGPSGSGKSASSKPASYAPPQPNTVPAEGGIEEIYDLEFPVEVDMPGVGMVEKAQGAGGGGGCWSSS